MRIFMEISVIDVDSIARPKLLISRNIAIYLTRVIVGASGDRRKILTRGSWRIAVNKSFGW